MWSEKRSLVDFIKLRERGIRLPSVSCEEISVRNEWLEFFFPIRNVTRIDDKRFKLLESFVDECNVTGYNYVYKSALDDNVLWLNYLRFHQFVALQEMDLTKFCSNISFNRKSFLLVYNNYFQNYKQDVKFSSLLYSTGKNVRFRNDMCCQYFAASFFCSKIFELRSEMESLSQYRIVVDIVKLMIVQVYTETELYIARRIVRNIIK